ncbi:MAG: tRNA (adenosine(37)-N6)-threonylcarbamoyltransferase complex dimerization subunit type 1 TsaB [Proteobacteria bacterium]|jgi:tRNA threonylcarbamoyl adenosine modification protein YeaZ|nr:tRNA (adenosine(37)-N6)-threonylcarbamoyltransferase complex dimerization subunit type 1 TsaB [Pseudomonadota bacterium]
MKLLAIETCFGKTSVCLYVNGELFEKIESEKNRQVNSLPMLVQELFEQHKLSTKNLDGVIVNHGPGAFTGIRVGIAFAKGLVAPLEVPLYGISTLECFAFKKCVMAVQALKEHVYFQEFDNDASAVGEAIHISITDVPAIENLITVGVNIAGEEEHFPEMPLASNLMKRFLFKKPALLGEPMYVRPVNAVIPQNMKKILCK